MVFGPHGDKQVPTMVGDGVRPGLQSRLPKDLTHAQVSLCCAQTTVSWGRPEQTNNNKIQITAVSKLIAPLTLFLTAVRFFRLVLDTWPSAFWDQHFALDASRSTLHISDKNCYGLGIFLFTLTT